MMYHQGDIVRKLSTMKTEYCDKVIDEVISSIF